MFFERNVFVVFVRFFSVIICLWFSNKFVENNIINCCYYLINHLSQYDRISNKPEPLLAYWKPFEFIKSNFNHVVHWLKYIFIGHTIWRWIVVDKRKIKLKYKCKLYPEQNEILRYRHITTKPMKLLTTVQHLKIHTHPKESKCIWKKKILTDIIHNHETKIEWIEKKQQNKQSLALVVINEHSFFSLNIYSIYYCTEGHIHIHITRHTHTHKHEQCDKHTNFFLRMQIKSIEV